MKKLVALTLIAVFALVGFANLTVHAGGTTVNFTGFVYNEDSINNAPVAGAEVVLLGTSFGGFTNSNGIVVLNNVPEGQYTIQISKPGFETKQEVIIISADYLSRSFSIGATGA